MHDTRILITSVGDCTEQIEVQRRIRENTIRQISDEHLQGKRRTEERKENISRELGLVAGDF